MKVIFIAMKNADQTEGRGPMVMDSAWGSKEIADQYIDTQPGVMGRQMKWSEEKYGDWKVEEITVFDSLMEYHKHETDKIKKQALNKLTPLERKALGV